MAYVLLSVVDIQEWLCGGWTHDSLWLATELNFDIFAETASGVHDCGVRGLVYQLDDKVWRDGKYRIQPLIRTPGDANF